MSIIIILGALQVEIIHSSPGSSSPGSAHKITWIFVLYIIIHVYAARAPHTASRNRVNSDVLLLTISTWHFPLSHEEVR